MKDKITAILKKYAGHEHVFLTPSGNKAIFISLNIIKESPNATLLIPDQGGWFTYSQYAKKLKFNIKILKTDYGIIDLDFLKDNIKEASAIIYSNPAAYYAEQPVKDIYELCRKNNVLVILDISGCIGSDFYKGNYADLIVCSFGRWKPLNLGYGGFISIANKGISEIHENQKFLGHRKSEGFSSENKKMLESLEFDENYYAALYPKLKNLKKRYEFFEKTNKKIKDELKNFNILHKSKKGINVIVKFSNDDEKNKIISYCEKNKYELVVCPKLIRVNENAISIEVKRLE